ncbi:MAG: hypothetical protein V4760_18720 [Bdellovibrionota bacterium]
MKRPLSYFVITFESFDTEEFTRALRAFDQNGVIVVWNYSGRIRVVHAPDDLHLKNEARFFTPKTWTENRWVKWMSLAGTMGRLINDVLTQRTAKRFFLGGGDVILWIAQLYKMAGRIEKIVTTCEDWAMPERAHDFYDWVNRTKCLVNDWLMVKFGCRVIVFTREIYDLRNDYWNDRTKPGAVLFENKWASFLEKKAALPEARPGRSICLLGSMRRNFGLEILFDLMLELNREHGIRLKVIGVESPLYREFKKACDDSGASQAIDWLGFVDNADLGTAVSDCFCGFDMQEKAENNSKWIVPGRIVNYLQHLIVPTISVHSGVIVNFVRDHRLGVVCQPERSEIKHAILDAFENYDSYAKNIDTFFETNPYKRPVTDLLDIG